MRVLVALFLVGHGLVHAIDVGQARRLYRVEAGATWPDGSWALTRAWGDPTTGCLVAIVFSLVAAAFAVAGVALLARAPWWAPWWAPITGVAAVASAIVLVVAWDGRLPAGSVADEQDADARGVGLERQSFGAERGVAGAHRQYPAASWGEHDAGAGTSRPSAAGTSRRFARSMSSTCSSAMPAARRTPTMKSVFAAT